VRSHNSGLLADKIEPFTYQVTKEECLDLPDKVFDTIQFGMTLEQRIAYEQTKWDLLLSLDIDQINSHTIFRLFSALQQIVSGFLKEGDFYQEFSHCRLDTLLSLIDCLPEDKKIIIWCKYRYSLKTIAAALDGVSLFYGDLNEADRSAELEKFRGENRFFVATQATGGHGLTLNETHYVIFYENEFKYANRLQAEDRCHRIGQEHKVTYIDIGCANSIDDRITDSLAKKGNLVQDFKRELDNIKDKTKMAKTL
jgi:SNF2 family DNA or RNA helicase